MMADTGTLLAKRIGDLLAEWSPELDNDTIEARVEMILHRVNTTCNHCWDTDLRLNKCNCWKDE